MRAKRQLQLSTQQQKERNNNTYYKKAKSFWQSYDVCRENSRRIAFRREWKKELIYYTQAQITRHA